MKTTCVGKNLEIRCGKGGAFAYENRGDQNLPRAHQCCLVIGPRGAGKTTAVVNLMERMPFDRIFAISPTAKSNKELLARLKIEEEDVFPYPNDTSCLDKVVSEIEKEREDYERYWEEMRRYRKLMNAIKSESPLFNLDNDALMDFYKDGDFQKPEHKWGGQKPCMALLIDDAIGSGIYTKGIKKLNSMVILHRHQGQLKEGGALGISMFFLQQSYKTQAGGISKCIRNNATSLIVFSNKNEKQLEEISEECAGEVSPETFRKVYETAIQDKHDFLFVDLHPRPNHSMFRRNLSEFIWP